MARLVEGDDFLLLRRDDLVLLFKTTNDAVDGIEEVLLANQVLALASGHQSGFVANIGNVGTREAGRLLGQEVLVDIVIELQVAHVDFENLLTPYNIRQLDVDLSVETACTEQGLVQNVGAVGRCQHDDTRIGAEAVHLGKQLVQRTFALVVTASDGTLATSATDGINLVDEDDARCFRLGVVEQIADARGTHTDKHLHEVGTRKAEERHVSLTSHRLGQQGLTSSRRAYQQHALRNLAAQLGVFLRILQEVDDLHNLHFGFFETCHVLECHIDRTAVFVIQLRTRLADIENRASATHATPHATHQNDVKNDEQAERNHP